MNDCPQGKFRNPETRRCVGYTTNVGRKILAKYPHLRPKQEEIKKSLPKRISPKKPIHIVPKRISPKKSIHVVPKRTSLKRASPKRISPKKPLPKRTSPKRNLSPIRIKKLSPASPKLIKFEKGQITRNYQCENKNNFDTSFPHVTENDIKDIKQCSRHISDINLVKKLGEGSYGVVYSVEITFNNTKKRVALKKINYKNDKYIQQNTDGLIYQTELSYLMGSVGIGPIIYDSFFIKKKDYINQYIFMELGDGSVADLLDEHNSTSMIIVPFIKNAIEQMINITKEQIYKYDLYCSDIKPHNFIFTINDGCLKVKMIDFDDEFCKNSLSRKTTKNDFFALVIIQIFMMIYHHTKIRDIEIFRQFYKNDIFLEYSSDTKFGVESLHKTLHNNSFAHDSFIRYSGTHNETGAVFISVALMNAIYKYIHNDKSILKPRNKNKYFDINSKYMRTHSLLEYSIFGIIKLSRNVPSKNNYGIFNGTESYEGIIDSNKKNVYIDVLRLPKSQVSLDYIDYVLERRKINDVLDLFYFDDSDDKLFIKQFIIYDNSK